jgi:hypothetical protein
MLIDLLCIHQSPSDLADPSCVLEMSSGNGCNAIWAGRTSLFSEQSNVGILGDTSLTTGGILIFNANMELQTAVK